MLINGVDMIIKLTRAPESFYFKAPSGDNKINIKMLDAIFYHSSRIGTPLLLAHANVLAMKRKAHYPLTHTQIKTFTAISGAHKSL